jgi:Arc/MetJ-type ribon-helix-helix transcriptional regulator
MSKERLTVTVDPQLVEAANSAVAEGRVTSLSAWVNQALAERADKDRRLRALADAVAAYEAEFGVITPAELEAQERADRASARVVRGSAPRGRESQQPRRRRKT